jgi:hypothetical protein
MSISGKESVFLFEIPQDRGDQEAFACIDGWE